MPLIISSFKPKGWIVSEPIWLQRHHLRIHPPPGGVSGTSLSLTTSGRTITYVQNPGCPSAIYLDNVVTNPSVVSPGTNVVASITLRAPTAPGSPLPITCDILFNALGTSFTLSTVSTTWAPGQSFMVIPLSFTMPNLGLAPNTYVVGTLSVACTGMCQTS